MPLKREGSCDCGAAHFTALIHAPIPVNAGIVRFAANSTAAARDVGGLMGRSSDLFGCAVAAVAKKNTEHDLC